MKKIKVGISTCLLGERVRYDGQHKLDRYIVNTLGDYLEFCPVCPEVECGLPVPREAMRLVGDPKSPRLMTIKSENDITGQMKEWSSKRLDELEKEELCGFIFKSKSPSSGMERVKVYPEGGGMPQKNGSGIFADMFMKRFPSVAVEEEGRLHDPVLRENFIERLFVTSRWKELLEQNPTPAGLVDFHTRHKLLLMAHSPDQYRSMGKLVADLKKTDTFSDVLNTYLKELVTALKRSATNSKNVNVLHHILGYFKKELSRDEKAELLEIIDHYSKSDVPLVVPVTMLNHYVRKYEQEYLNKQYYLNPHPIELQLRNHC